MCIRDSYYSRTEAGKQYPIRCRKKGSLDAPEEVVLDVNELAQGRVLSVSLPNRTLGQIRLYSNHRGPGNRGSKHYPRYWPFTTDTLHGKRQSGRTIGSINLLTLSGSQKVTYKASLVLSTPPLVQAKAQERCHCTRVGRH